MVKVYNVGAHGIPLDLKLEVIRLAQGPLTLRYTRHAMGEALSDRYGCLAPSSFPTAFKCFEDWTLVETEETNGKLSKFVVRRPVDDTRSLVLVILVDGAVGLVKTLWTNLNTDSHATLDKSKFSTP